MKKVIYGPPGTGKTNSLVTFLKDYVNNYQLKSGKQPTVRFLSFTKAPVEEALRRIHIDLPSSAVSTIHSYGFRIAGFGKEQVIQFEQLNDFFSKMNIPYEGEEGSEATGKLYLDTYAYAVNCKISIEDAYHKCGAPGQFDEYKWCITSYIDYKKSHGYVDFNDMLVAAVEVEPPYSDLLILDEAQDLTPLQWDVFEQLASQATNLLVAGDDDQAIFTHTGSDPHGMRKFAESHKVEERTLTKSWRLNKQVHAYADTVVKRIATRVPKVFDHRGEEGTIKFTSTVDFKKLVAAGPFTILGHDRFTLAEVEKEVIGVAPYDFPRSRFLNSRAAKVCQMIGKLRHEPETGLTAQQIDMIKKQIRPSIASQLRPDNLAILMNRPIVDIVNLPPHQIDKYVSHQWGVPPTVKLRTIHQYKGLEEDTVVLYSGRTDRAETAHMIDPDGGHRVFYVGVTRARHNLIVVDTGGYPV